MSPDIRLSHRLGGFALALVAAASFVAPLEAADWVPFDELPRAERVRAMQGKLGGFGRGERIREVRWDLAAGDVAYQLGERWWAAPLAGGEPRVLEGEPPPAASTDRPRRRPGGGGAGRGRQVASVPSPDGTLVAEHRDGNLFLRKADATEGTAITVDGNAKLKYGSASWVYGEELDQTTAMWWSPDGTKLAFYRFDDRPVKDFWLLSGWATNRTGLMSEAYPKPGEPNPIADLLIYDVASGATVDVDTGPETDQYVYGVEWTEDGAGLLFHRTNRRQDTLELMLANPTDGTARAILVERQPTWQENSPTKRFLDDGRRFLWETEQTGFSQYELRSLDGSAPITVTSGQFPVESIVRVDEDPGVLWYTARSSETGINPQLHRASLTGGHSVRLTPDDLHWSGFRIAPDGRAFVATSEFVDRPAETWLFRVEGDSAVRVTRLSGPGEDPWAAIGASTPEFLRLKAADGVTEVYGILWKPSDFDPSKRYPLVVMAYGGPHFALISSRMAAPRAEAEFGVLLATIDNRGTPGRGKAFEAANYLSLGEEDCDDQAAMVRQLAARPYVDASRVAITGHSYGGFMTLVAMLRYPEVFGVGVAGAAPTDWRQYDTIYTERYMRTPAENPEGYDRFSAVKLAPQLKGELLLLQGMVDDNVHPTNLFAFADVLQGRAIPFDMMLFPRADHGIFSPAEEAVKWSFLLRHLGLWDPDAKP